MQEREKRTIHTHRRLLAKHGPGSMGQLIFSLFLLMLLVGCGSSLPPSTYVTPTPRPSPTATPSPTSTQGITPTPTATPSPMPTPSPTPQPPLGACDTLPGITPVSSVEVDQGRT